LKKVYQDAGINVLVSAFGAFGNVTSKGFNATVLASKMAKFVLDTNFDGVDVDWEDTATLKKPKGTVWGDQWVTDFIQELRRLLPYHIITFAPEASFFNQNNDEWKGHSYMNVHNNLKGCDG
jgi:chitinase